MSRAPRAARAALPKEQPTHNPERGEDALLLGETTYRLRPSKAALKAIETKTDKSVLALVRMGNTGELKIEQLGVIAAELIKAGAEDELTRNAGATTLEDLIMEEGLPQVTARLSLCLWDASTGGRDAAGNVKAATA